MGIKAGGARHSCRAESRGWDGPGQSRGAKARDRSVPPTLTMILLASALAASILVSALALAAAARYGDKAQVELSDEESAALETLGPVLRSAAGKALAVDPRLVLAARELARQYQDDTADEASIFSTRNQTRVMGEQGLYEDSPGCIHFFFSTQDDIRFKLRKNAQRVKYTHLGAGAVMPQGMKYGVLVVLLVDRRAELEPFPRQVALPSSWTLKGRLVNSCRGDKVKVLVTSPGGQVRTIEAVMKGGAFAAAIPFDRVPGTYRVEVEGIGEGTATIAALMEVTAGGPGGADSSTFEVTGFDRVPESESRAEDMMVEMINQVRFKEGLEAVTDDPHLKELARTMSRDMRKHRYVGHLSPELGTLHDRVLAAGLADYTVKENVALDNSLVQVMNNLLKSPAHRATIIDPDVNSVGVGVSFSGQGNDHQYYVCQEFAKMY